MKEIAFWRKFNKSTFNQEVATCTHTTFFYFISVRSLREFITDDSSVLHDKVVLEDALDFYKMAIELFKWDFLHQNVLSWAVHMTGCVIRKLLSTRTLDDLKKVSGCLQLLKYAERLLTHIYCRVTEDGARDTCGLVPVNQGDTVQYSRYWFILICLSFFQDKSKLNVPLSIINGIS